MTFLVESTIIPNLMMHKVFLLLLMVFLHIIEDFHLQGILAKMKQLDWWLEQPEYTDKYLLDFIAALFAHSFEWTFMMMLPIFFFAKFTPTVAWIFIYNMLCHAIVDNAKCNAKKINLIVDQTIHIVQIVLTWAFIIL